MVTLPTTAFLICLQLAAGSFMLMPIAPIREFGLSFFRTMATIATIIMAIGLYVMPFGTPITAGASEFGRLDTQPLVVSYGVGAVAVFGVLFASMLAYTVAIWTSRLGAAAVLLVTAAVGSMVAIGVSAAPFVEVLNGTWSRMLAPASFYAASIFQAAGLVGMILGHQYLMPVKLPFRPFEVLSWVFLVGCIAQTVLVGISLALELAGPRANLLAAMLSLDHPLGLFLWIRLGVGLILVGVVAAMTIHCVRLRANMAATGLLYVGMSMAVGGEIFGRILTLTTSILM